MKCPHCHEPLDAGAAFCGNCGQHLQAAPAPSTIAARSERQAGEMKALIALLFGVMGLVGAVFIPLIGITFGVAGVVLATMSLSVYKRALAGAGLAVAGLAVFAGLTSWVYVIQEMEAADSKLAKTAPAKAELSTPCYSVALLEKLNASIQDGSCDAIAYDGSSQEDSAKVYKIYASESASIDEAGFHDFAKQALEKDVAASLPGYSIESWHTTSFADSPAYSVVAVSKDKTKAVVETAVLRPTAGGDNVFVIVHTAPGKTANLQLLEAGWQWK